MTSAIWEELLTLDASSSCDWLCNSNGRNGFFEGYHTSLIQARGGHFFSLWFGQTFKQTGFQWFQTAAEQQEKFAAAVSWWSLGLRLWFRWWFKMKVRIFLSCLVSSSGLRALKRGALRSTLLLPAPPLGRNSFAHLLFFRFFFLFNFSFACFFSFVSLPTSSSLSLSVFLWNTQIKSIPQCPRNTSSAVCREATDRFVSTVCLSEVIYAFASFSCANMLFFFFL